MLPFNKRPGRDAREEPAEPENERPLQRSSRAVPPPARSQPRLERLDAVEPVRPFQASRSDDEVTTFMSSPVKKGTPAPFEETGETATALHHVRPPAPSEPDEEEESHTQIRHMPRRGRSAQQPRREPPAPRAEQRVPDHRIPEISLSKSAAVLDLPDEDHETGASAPDFTVQLGPSVALPGLAPMMQAPPPPAMAPMGQMAPMAQAPVPHTFAPVTSAPLVSRSQPPPAMQQGMPGMQMPMQTMQGLQAPQPQPSAMRSGPVPAMPAMMGPSGSAMRSGPVPQMPQTGFQQQPGFGAVPPHFSVPPARGDARMDPPGMAVSLSRAAPKPARVWMMAFGGLSVAAACAAFGLTHSGPNQATTAAAFVDPAVAPGGRGVVPEPGAPPAAPAAPPVVAQPQPVVAAAQPVQPSVATSPADLLTQPIAAQPAVAAAEPPKPVAAIAAVAPEPVAQAPVAQAPSKGGTAPKPAPVAAAAPKPVEPKPVAAKPEPKPVAAKPEPKPVAVAAPPPKPTPAKGEKKPATAADKEMKDAADALARAQLEQSL